MFDGGQRFEGGQHFDGGQCFDGGQPFHGGQCFLERIFLHIWAMSTLRQHTQVFS